MVTVLIFWLIEKEKKEKKKKDRVMDFFLFCFCFRLLPFLFFGCFHMIGKEKEKKKRKKWRTKK